MFAHANFCELSTIARALRVGCSFRVLFAFCTAPPLPTMPNQAVRIPEATLSPASRRAITLTSGTLPLVSLSAARRKRPGVATAAQLVGGPFVPPGTSHERASRPIAPCRPVGRSGYTATTPHACPYHAENGGAHCLSAHAVAPGAPCSLSGVGCWCTGILPS